MLEDTSAGQMLAVTQGLEPELSTCRTFSLITDGTRCSMLPCGDKLAPSANMKTNNIFFGFNTLDTFNITLNVWTGVEHWEVRIFLAMLAARLQG